jgi:pyrimidine-nucleoside phosphorylase
VSLALAPLVASFGLVVPMMSGRGLGHTGGTLDKLESLPGLTTSLTSAQFMEQLQEVRVAICGPTETIAPVDKTLYALRDVTGTASSLPLIVSSIMSKKLAEGPDALLLDVKTGDGAFLPDWESAHKLAAAMLAAGEQASKRMVVVMTDMGQPLGRAVGNWLELREAVDVLSGRGPSDVTELVLAQCALMLVLGGRADSYLDGRRLAELHLGNGKGMQQLRLLARAQGATAAALAFLDKPADYPASQRSVPVVAAERGWVSAVGAREIGAVNVLLGGGREDKSSVIDPKAGIVLHRKVGDAVQVGEVVATLYSDVAPETLAAAAARTWRAFRISPVPQTVPPLITHILINGSTLPWADFLLAQSAQ